jgi:hypothetical protein
MRARQDDLVSKMVVVEEGGGAFRVSPNGQFDAVEVQPNVSVLDSDEYVMVSRPRSVTTYVVDIASGAVTRSVEGFGAVWR